MIRVSLESFSREVVLLYFFYYFFWKFLRTNRIEPGPRSWRRFRCEEQVPTSTSKKGHGENDFAAKRI